MMLVMSPICCQLLGFLCSRRTSVRAGRKLGQAKIAQLDVTAAVEEDVGWLEVAAAVPVSSQNSGFNIPIHKACSNGNGNKAHCMT